MDAVIVIAPAAGTEKRGFMKAPVVVCCRVCRSLLHADASLIAIATDHPVRVGRPIDFLCPTCATSFDPHTVGTLIAHDPGKANAANN